MGDMGEVFREMKDYKRNLKKAYGVECPDCKKKYPKGHPTIMLPQQKCNVCGYIDRREILTVKQKQDAQNEI